MIGKLLAQDRDRIGVGVGLVELRHDYRTVDDYEIAVAGRYHEIAVMNRVRDGSGTNRQSLSIVAIATFNVSIFRSIAGRRGSLSLAVQA